jgi:hypothetical protein
VTAQGAVNLRRYVFALVSTGVVTCAACSESATGPNTVDLNGVWRMTYTASESAFTCSFHDILLVFDSMTMNPRLMTGGTGRCVGRGRNDSLFLSTSIIDSLEVGGGRIRFTVFAGSYRFDGRIVSKDSVDGTTTQDGFYTGIGAMHLVGPWGAHRRPPLPN